MNVTEIINKLIVLSVADDVHTMTADDRKALQEAAGLLNHIKSERNLSEVENACTM